MSRRINQVEDVFIPVLTVIHKPGGLELYGYASFPFQVHIVKKLLLHITLRHQPGFFDKSVGQCGFAVVNVSNYAEISYIFLVVHSVV